MAAAAATDIGMAAAAAEALPCNNNNNNKINISTFSYQLRIISKPITISMGRRRLFVRRRASLNQRCEGAEPEEEKGDGNGNGGGDSRVLSQFAIEQLKTLGPDRYTKEKSSIVVLGLNIRTAPVEMREKLAIAEAEWPQAIGELCNLNHIEEAAVLSTCNRVEIYVLALSWHRGVKEVTEWMTKKSGIPCSELCHHLILLRDGDATQHLFEVSAGLDSLILGEGQILAQVKQVLQTGQRVKGFGTNISGLFKRASTVGKRIRTETNIAAGAVSVSSAAVELAIKKLPQHSSATARMLIIGAGKMAKLVIKHLVAKGWTKMVVVNRNEMSVADIREEFKAVEIIYRPLTEMLTCAAEADVVFTCTSSKAPLFSKEKVEALSPVSLMIGGSRIFIDISVPRNVSSCVSDVEHAQLYNVDDLKQVVAANKKDRRRKAMEAHSIIVEESKKFEDSRNSAETFPTMNKLRDLVKHIRTTEVKRCFSKMGDNVAKKTRKAIEDLCCGITNKLLYDPTLHLRCNASEVLENMNALNRMFNLETDASLLGQKDRAKMEQTRRETQ